jgi:hypothetical protein
MISTTFPISKGNRENQELALNVRLQTVAALVAALRSSFGSPTRVARRRRRLRAARVRRVRVFGRPNSLKVDSKIRWWIQQVEASQG